MRALNAIKAINSGSLSGLTGRAKWLVQCGACLLFISFPCNAAQTGGEQPQFMMDESVWATFYDLPSRRFRTIRDAFIRRQFNAVDRDLAVSIGFLAAEAQRAVDPLSVQLAGNIDRLNQIRSNVRDESVSVGDLDAAFARAHWLLAQHYLVLAKQSRDSNQHNNAGLYLWATAHHLERAVLWSDARIDQDVTKSLEATRKMGAALQSSDRPDRVYREKPIALTTRTLVEIGEQLNRKVWVREVLEAPE